jgi:hypothetical protein
MSLFKVGFRGSGGTVLPKAVEADSPEGALRKINGPTLENTVALVVGNDALSSFRRENGTWVLLEQRKFP